MAGISLGFGYNNRIINSELESNYMGVVVMNADNNVQVERCVIVDCIVGIYIGGKDRNETKRNETKRNETKRNGRLCFSRQARNRQWECSRN